MKKNTKWPKPRPAKPNDNKDLYKNNFYIAKDKNKESYFSLEQNCIFFKTPTPNDEFELKAAYDLSNLFKTNVFSAVTNLKIILCHISDNTDRLGQNNNKSFFLEGEILFNEVLDIETNTQSNFTLNENDFVFVIVINENGEIYKETLEKNTKLLNFDNFLPNEGGGGVIIKYP